jgi:hypothetical protein
MTFAQLLFAATLCSPERATWPEPPPWAPDWAWSRPADGTVGGDS